MIFLGLLKQQSIKENKMGWKKYSKNWSSKDNGCIVKIYFLPYFWSMICNDFAQWIILSSRDISVSWIKQ